MRYACWLCKWKKFPKINASIVDSYIDECVKKLENIDFDSQYSDNSGTEEENKQTEKKNQDILQKIAKYPGGGWADVSSLKLNEEETETIKKLEHRDVLLVSKDKKKKKIKIPLYQKWICAN